MMSGDVSRARSIAPRESSASADDLEVGLPAEDVGDPHPEEGVIVDDEDPRDLVERSTIGTAAAAIGPAVISCAHMLSSPPTAGSVGIARRTTVPPSGRDRTSNRAPISSARSRMNWSPKLRRPRAATAPTSKPRPSSRTSSTQPSSSSVVADDDRFAAACLRTFCSASWATRRTTVRWLSLEERRPARQVGRDRRAGQRPHVFDRVDDRPVEAELVEQRRPELADERPDVAELAAEHLAQEAQLGPRQRAGRTRSTRSMYSTWKIVLVNAWAGPSWISCASRDRSASCASTMRICEVAGGGRAADVGQRASHRRARGRARCARASARRPRAWPARPGGSPRSIVRPSTSAAQGAPAGVVGTGFGGVRGAVDGRRRSTPDRWPSLGASIDRRRARRGATASGRASRSRPRDSARARSRSVFAL